MWRLFEHKPLTFWWKILIPFLLINEAISGIYLSGPGQLYTSPHSSSNKTVKLCFEHLTGKVEIPFLKCHKLDIVNVSSPILISLPSIDNPILSEQTKALFFTWKLTAIVRIMRALQNAAILSNHCHLTWALLDKFLKSSNWLSFQVFDSTNIPYNCFAELIYSVYWCIINNYTIHKIESYLRSKPTIYYMTKAFIKK